MRLQWDKVGERKYEMGTDRGVLYLMDDSGQYHSGVVWNGLISVTESPGGAEETAMYADNMKYASMRSAETFGATIEAYMSPEEFDICDGVQEVAKGVKIGQQNRAMFGFSYRTSIGNDTATTSDDGYKIHLVYGCTASPSEKAYNTTSDSPEAINLSWEITTTPVNVEGFQATATIIIDSTQCEPSKLKMLEDILYGTDAPISTVSTYSAANEETNGATARLPLPDEIIKMFSEDSPTEPPVVNPGEEPGIDQGEVEI